jgi:hypothetical protein
MVAGHLRKYARKLRHFLIWIHATKSLLKAVLSMGSPLAFAIIAQRAPKTLSNA